MSESKKDTQHKKFEVDCNGIADIIYSIHKENRPDDYEYLEKEYCLDFKNSLTKKGKFWFITKETLNQLFDNVKFHTDNGDTISDFYQKRKYKKPKFNIHLTGESYEFKEMTDNAPKFPDDLIDDDETKFTKKNFNFKKTKIYQYLSPLLQENSPNISPVDLINKANRNTLKEYIILHLLIIYDNLKEPFAKKQTIGGKTRKQRKQRKQRKHNKTSKATYPWSRKCKV